MTGNCVIIPFGGTIFMKDEGKGLAPFYRPNVIGLFEAIEKSERIPPEKKEGFQKRLLQGGIKAYPEIVEELTGRNLGGPGRSVTKAKSFISQRERIAKDYAHSQTLELFGFDKAFKFLNFRAIDSIDFDVKEHYFNGLLMSVMNTISAGNVPVITGGTDTLRFYGTLLAEELQRKGIKTPVIIVSSMRDFGGEENFPEGQLHVMRLLKGARTAAEYLVEKEKGGVYALVPDGVEVNEASLLDLQKPVDKISGQLTRAFVGTELEGSDGRPVRINPDDPINHTALSGLKKRDDHIDLDEVLNEARVENQAIAIDAVHKKLAEDKRENPTSIYNSFYRAGKVAPPLEHYNDANSLAAVLGALYFNNGHGFTNVIIKGIPEIDEEGVSLVSGMIKLLSSRGINISFVNDPVYNIEQKKLVPLQQDYDTNPLRATLAAAGAQFWPNGITSTQAFIRAGMGELPQTDAATPDNLSIAENAALRKLFAPDANKFNLRDNEMTREGISEYKENFKRWVGNQAQAIAIEYVPDMASYPKLLRVMNGAGIKEIISVNCTHGAMKSKALEDALPQKRKQTVHSDGRLITRTRHNLLPGLATSKKGMHTAQVEEPTLGFGFTAGFKYGGVQFPDAPQVEAADLGAYAASAGLNTLNVKIGGEKPIEVLYAEAISGRGVSSPAVA